MSERVPGLLGLLLVGLLLAGCSVQTTGQGNKQPQPPEEMAQGTTALTPVSSPDTPSVIARFDNRVEVSNPKTGTRWYIWSPDFSLLAYQTDTGIWAISPDGSVTQHLVKGQGKRDLVGWWDSGVVYLVPDESADSFLSAWPAGPGIWRTYARFCSANRGRWM